ncbi:MAG: hypothetical protein IJZ23_10640 [Roseburia sp.]|nr:hypothetical protein [Roseburia sp.]
MKSYNVDLLDGFDGREIVYDEKAERSYQARIWWALFIVAVLILLRGVTFHMDEIKLVNSGDMITANYNEDTAQASYIDDNGMYHQYDISGFSAEHDGDTINLYYEEEIAYAEPIHEVAFWIQTYLIFGTAILFIGWRLWKIYKKK